MQTEEAILEVKSHFEAIDGWLMVFDGGGPLDYLSSISSFLPAGSGGCIIITTSNDSYQERLGLGFARGLQLSRPQQAQSLQILLDELNTASSHETRVTEVPDTWRETIEDLPLVIRMAARHCAETGQHIKSYIAGLQNHPAQIQNCPRAIAYIFHQIQLSDSLLWSLICVLSFLDLKVERSFLQAVIFHTAELEALKAEHNMDKALSTLERLGFLQNRTSKEIYLYTAVQRWARCKIVADKELSHWQGRVMHVACIVHYPRLIPGLRDERVMSHATMIQANYFEAKGVDPKDASTGETLWPAYGSMWNMGKSTAKDAGRWFSKAWKRALEQ